MTLRFLLLFFIAAGLTHCKVNKKPTSANVIEKNITDEIVVTAKRGKSSTPYQASEKRVNDIQHMVLEVSFDYAKQQVKGKATLTIKPYFHPVTALDLDARHFDLKRVALVESDTQDLAYTYDSSVIHIRLNREYRSSESYKVFIDYIAKPNDNSEQGSLAINDAKGIYFINPLGTDPEKPRQIWTQGETQSNSNWFPTNDVPNEKLTHEIYITADEKDVTLSNGELIYSRVNNDQTHTDYWKQSLPHSPYLVMMAVGDFAIVKDSWRDSIEVSYYVEPKYQPYAKLIFGHTPEMLEFFSTRLGVAYPWEKFSQIVVRDFVSGAMENTSAVVHFDGLQHDAREHLDETHEDIISHELFHHWFGDLVTCESWSNLPLNESFATYGSYLWDEHKYDRMQADDNLNDNLDAYLNSRHLYTAKLVRFNYHNREDLFDVISYQKGSRVLHMLRNYVGDDAFFKSLQLYLNRHRFGNVEVHQLRLAFEEVTGEDLNWFFNQWFLGAGHPVLDVSYSFDAAHKQVSMTVTQLQDSATTGLFHLPLAVDIYSNGKAKREKITVSKASEIFMFGSDAPIQLVNFDADKMLLAAISDTKTMDEALFLLQHAPLYMDKVQATGQIVSLMSDSATPQVITAVNYALSHEYAGVRESGLEIIDKLNNTGRAQFATHLQEIARHDSKASLRTEAMYMLADMDAAAYKQVFIAGVNDSSYSVMRAALEGLGQSDPEQALQLIQGYQDSPNEHMQVAYGRTVALYGKGNYVEFFNRSLGKYGTGSRYTLLSSYGRYLQRTDSTTMKQAIPGLQKYFREAKGEDMYARMIIERLVSELKAPYEDQLREAQARKKKLKSADPAQAAADETIARAQSMIAQLNSITRSAE